MRRVSLVLSVFLAAGCGPVPLPQPLITGDGGVATAVAVNSASGLSDAGLAPPSEDIPRLYAEYVARQRCPDEAHCGAPPVRTISRLDCTRADEKLPPEARCAFRVRISYRMVSGAALPSRDYDCIGLFAVYPEGWRMFGLADVCVALPALPEPVPVSVLD